MMFPVLVTIGFMLTASLSSNITAELQNVSEDALLSDIILDVSAHLSISNQQQKVLRFPNV